jgi:hypothetical protein
VKSEKVKTFPNFVREGFWHTLSKSIHTASFFEIDPWFKVSG